MVELKEKKTCRRGQPTAIVKKKNQKSKPCQRAVMVVCQGGRCEYGGGEGLVTYYFNYIT